MSWVGQHIYDLISRFRADVNFEKGIRDKDGDIGTAGQILSSTGNQVNWIDNIDNEGVTSVTGTTNRISSSGGATPVIDAITGTVTSSSANLATGSQIKTAIDAAVATIPSGLKYQGTWNASTNSPALASGTGVAGYYYVVSVAGSTNLDGITDWKVGDWAIFTDHTTDHWQKLDQSEGDTLQTVTTRGSTTTTGATFGGNLTAGNGGNGKIYFGSTSHYLGNIGANVYLVTTGQAIFDIGGSEKMRLTSGGNLGLGSTSPQQKLHINGSVLIENNNELRWKDSGGAQRTILELTNANDLYFGGSFAGSLIFVGGGSYTERMRISDSGNVLIGTTTDSGGKLSVVGSPTTLPLLVLRNTGTASSNDIYMGYNRDNSTGSNGWSTGIDSTDNAFHISEDADSINNNVRLKIKAGGNVGIFNTNPTVALEVGANSTGNTKRVIFNGEGGNATNLILKSRTNRSTLILSDNDTTAYFVAEGSKSSWGFGSNISSANNILIDSSGNVAIGSTITNSGAKLHVTGNSLFTGNITLTASSGHPILTTASGKDLNINSGTNNIYINGNPTVSGALTGTTATFTGLVSGITPTSSANFTTKAYVDAQVGASDTLQEVTDNGATTTNNITIGSTYNTLYKNDGFIFTDNQDYNIKSGSTKILDLHFNEIKSYIGGSEKMRLTSTGLAIGSTSANGKLDITQSSATDPVLRLTDDGVANYDFIFPDTNTIKLETNTSSTKTFKLLNAGSGGFNLEASGAVFSGTASFGGEVQIASLSVLGWGGNNNFIFGDSSNNYVAIGTNGGQKMRITSSGNVGIGLTSPQSRLSLGSTQSGGIDFLYDTSNNYKNQILNYWNSGTDTRMDFNIGRVSGATPATVMSVGYGGKVGIGTVSPDSPLEILSTTSPQLRVTHTDNTYYMTVGHNGTFDIVDGAGSNKFDFRRDGTSKMNILTNGNVLIGTTADSGDKLNVYQASSFKVGVSTGNPIINIVNNTAVNNTAGTATLKFTQGNTQTGGKIVSGRDGNYSSGGTRNSNLQFYTSTSAVDTEKMRLTAAGNLLVGGTNENAKLTVRADSGYAFRTENASGNTFRIESSSGNIYTTGHLYVQDNKKIRIGDSGDLQIYHSGSHSYVDANNTGDLYIRSLNDDVVVQAADDVFIYTQGGEDAIIARGNGAVELYHDNSKKFETTASGIEVTGGLTGTTASFTSNITTGGYISGPSSGLSLRVGSTEIADFRSTEINIPSVKLVMNNEIQIYNGSNYWSQSVDSSGRFLMKKSSSTKVLIDTTGKLTLSAYAGTSTIGPVTYLLGTDVSGNVTKVLSSGPGSGVYLPLTGGTMSGTLGLSGGDAGVLLKSFNTSQSNAAQLVLSHVDTGVRINNARGALNFQTLNTTRLILGEGSTMAGTLTVNGLTSTTGTFSGNVTAGNVTAAGTITSTETTGTGRIRSGASGQLHLGDDSDIISVGRTNEMWSMPGVNSDQTLYLHYRGYNNAATRFRSFDIRDGKAGQIALFNGTDKSTTFAGNITIPSYIYHAGDANTNFGFSANDTWRVQTGGVNRFTVTDTAATFTGLVSGITPTSNANLATKLYVDTAINTIPAGLTFEGNWNASTDSPSLAGTTPANGIFYIVSVNGSTSLSGITDWKVGDWAVYVSNGGGADAWQKIDNTSTLSGAGVSGQLAYWNGTTVLAGDSDATFDGTNLNIGGHLTAAAFTGQHFQDTSDSSKLINPAGASSINSLSLSGSLTGTSATFSGNVKPSTSGSIDFGGSSNRWATVYTNNISTTSSSTFGGDIVLDDHIDSSPSLYFFNQDNNFARILFDTNENLLYKIGTSEKMRLSNSGALSIGNTNSTYKLNVGEGDIYINSASAGGGRGLYIQRNGAANAWSVLQGHFGDNNLEIREGSNTRMKFLAGGNVGIGLANNTNPSATLHVVGSAGSTTTIEGSTQSTLNLKTTSGNKNNYIVGTTAGDLSFRPNGVTSTTLKANGNLLLGTTTDSGYRINLIPSNGNIFKSTRGTSILGAYQSNSSHVYLGTISNHEFRIIQNDGVALTIDQQKNLTLVGSLTGTTATFAGNVDVNGTQITVGTNGSIFAENNLRFKSSGAAYIDHNTTGQSFIFRTSTSSSLDTTALTLTNAGNATFAGTVSAEDNIHLTDSGTVRGKLLLNSSDRDNIELRAESLGSTMKFFTVGTEALLLDASQNAAFAGYVSATQFRPTNIVTNKVVKFNGIQLDDANITDTGSLITLGSNTVVSGELEATSLDINGTADISGVLSTGSAVCVNLAANVTSQALQVNGFIDIVDVTSSALRWFNGSTFRGGLGLDSWAHSGSSSDMTMYIAGDNSFHISTNNVKRVEVDSSGTTFSGNITAGGYVRSNTALYVQRPGVAAGVAQLEVTGSGLTVIGPSGYHPLIVQEAGVEKFRIRQGNGNVGIGTSSPDSKLHVASGTNADGVLLTGLGTSAGMGTGNYKAIDFQYSAADSSFGSAIRFVVASHTAHGGQIELWTDNSSGTNTKALTINKSQNATFTGLVSGITPTAAANFTTKAYVDGQISANDSLEEVTNVGNSTSHGIVFTSTNFSIGGAKIGLHSNNLLYVRGGTTGLMLQNGSGTTAHLMTTDHIFEVGSAEKMRLVSNGSLGIGTTSPSAKLSVKIGSANDQIQRWETTSGLAAILQTDLGFSEFNLYQPAGNAFVSLNTNGNSYFNGGKLGIGTTSPSFKLDVEGASTSGIVNVASFVNPVNAAGTGHGARIILHSTTDAGRGVAIASSSENNYAVDNAMLFYTGASSTLVEKMRLTSTGRLGINESNPTKALSVDGSAYITGSIQGNTAVMTDVSGVSSFGSNTSTRSIRIGRDTTANDIFILGSNGHVGIGTASPAYPLDISGTGQTTARVVSTNNGGARFDLHSSGGGRYSLQALANGDFFMYDESTGHTVQRYFDGAAGAWTWYTAGTEKMRLTSGGNLGVGTTDPLTKLDVNGIITAGGKITYRKSAGSLNTTGYAVAGLLAYSNGNGQSGTFIFTCGGGANAYQKIVYSVFNVGGTWTLSKVIDEGTNHYDITHATSAVTGVVTFTFKTRSGTQSYTPQVLVEHFGSINTYINYTYGQ